MGPMLLTGPNPGPQPGSRSGGMAPRVYFPNIVPSNTESRKAPQYQPGSQAGDPSFIVGGIFATNSGAATSAVGSLASPVVGDLNVLAIEVTGASTLDPGLPTIDGNAISASGWTVLGSSGLSSVNGSSNVTRMTIVARVFQGGDPLSVTWGWTNPSSYTTIPVAIQAGSFDATTPVEGAAIQNQASSSVNFPLPSITTTVRGVLLEIAGCRTAGFWTMPGTLLSEAYASSSASIAVSVEPAQAAGTFSSQTATFSAATSVGQTAIISIRSNPAGSDVPATAALSATHTLTATATKETFSTAALSATATLTATAVVTKNATATLSATHTTTATGTVQKDATATLSATHTTTASAVVTKVGTATLSATHTTTATATRETFSTAALSATHTLTGAANSTVNATAALSATHTTTATAVRETFSTAALSATHTTTATAVVTKIATAALSVTHTTTATGVVTKNATAALTATHTLTVTAVVEKIATASLSATHTLTATAGTLVSATAALSATHTLTATSFVTTSATATLTATHTLTAIVTPTFVGLAGLGGWGAIGWGMVPLGATYSGSNASATATLSATHTTTASAFVARFNVVTLVGTATLTANATKTSATATAVLNAIATLTAVAMSAGAAIWIELVVNNGTWSVVSVTTNPYVESVPGAPVYSEISPTGSTWVEVPVAPKIWS